MTKHFAHTRPGTPPDRWQPLEEHLVQVSELAAGFAAALDAREWGRLAGLWHDLGKYARAFQEYLLRGAGDDYHQAEIAGRIDHSTAGAQHAVERIPVFGHLLAYVISGHHAGLMDGISEGACLDARLRKTVEPWRHGLQALERHLSARGRGAPRVPRPPRRLLEALRASRDPGATDEDRRRAAFACAFFTRMLFSCLVDADFLDTERFLDPERSARRPRWPADILERMEKALERYVRTLPERAPVDRVRAEVREQCLEAAAQPPGLFSLTVPTGGGKTLSSLAFALRHALRHGLRRIIYVIPFTSIIEQNAEVFRSVFRPLVREGISDPVLEHHSTLDVGRETAESRLAAENWDAPLVVTTSVQFFESLFANRPARCRKLHNMLGSVVILDEAQKVPVDKLAPCLYALQELVRHGSTVVLCTATQPAVRRRDGFPIGLEGVREIIRDPDTLHERLRRVEIEHLGLLDDEDLAARVRGHEQVLCIVNTRAHARELFERVGAEARHLSAAMCPAHRSAVLLRIRKDLDAGRPCRVVSTQLVEAGVDLDFPVVYRALAGLDAVAQAAGRCNRNGHRPRGCTFVFETSRRREERFLADTADAARQVLGRRGSGALADDILSRKAVEHYFRLYYWSRQQEWDASGVLEDELPGASQMPFLFRFRTAAERFRLIGDEGVAILVPWGEEGQHLCEKLRRMGGRPPATLLRALQRFAVQVPRRTYDKALGRSVELVHDRYSVLISPELHYDRNLGLVLDREVAAAEDWVV